MRSVAIAGLFVALAAPAFGRPPDSTLNHDSNRLICRTSDEIGSRLHKKRTCLTASAWLQLERDQRETVDRVQKSGQRFGQ